MKSTSIFGLLRSLVVVLAASIVIGSVSAAGKSTPSGFENFITREGNKLYDGDKVFRFAGANMPGIMLPYDFTLFLPERMNLPTPWEQEDAFKTLKQMNAGVVRTWNLPVRGPDEPAKPWHYVLAPGQFNEESFKVVDSMFALANQYGVRVIFSLTAGSGDYLGGIKTYAKHRGKTREEFYTDPQIKEDYKTTVRYVLNRTNTLTGVKYNADKCVLAWQFGNELITAPAGWLSEMAAYIKSQAPNQLVAETVHRPGKPMLIDPHIDLVTRHLYPDYPGTEKGWIPAIQKEMAILSKQRPLFIGEYGPYIDNKMFTKENVVGKTRDFLSYLESEDGIAGSLFWSMYFHHQDGGYYWHQIMTYPAAWSYHWPGSQTADEQQGIKLMATLREAGFRIQGLKVPAVPVPDSPELLPIGEVPLLTWRGSAGASGYEIQRAPAAKGPWETIASDVSDTNAVYRPLYSDRTAKSGETYFYRVAAMNSTGKSKPSESVGPVKVKSICLMDELQDFSLIHSRSPGLVLENDFNAIFAEYMFRADGKSGDELVYQVPSAMEEIRIVCFVRKEKDDFSFLVSADGTTYSPLQPERKARPLPATPKGAAKDQKRTMVEYNCPVPAGNRFLKILWNGPAELDRVEIHHP
jgi:hypothetical protein